MDLELIKNQLNIFNRLKNAYKNDRLSHAYLFYGKSGTGKLEMAYALACLLYCQNDCCFECEDCKNILAGNHLNVNYIGVEDNKKIISKEQIIKIQEEYSKTSLVEGTRIYIIDGIDTASIGAQNSLLKFIEEPANGTKTIGIFLATEISNVVSTIQSRCNLIHFEALELPAMIEILKNKDIDPFDAFLTCRLTNDPNMAYELVSDKDIMKAKGMLLELLEIGTKAEGVKYYLNHVSFFQTEEHLEILLKWLIGIVELVVNKNSNLQLNEIYDKISVYNSIRNVSVDKLSLLLKLQNKFRYNILAKNIFHELIVKWI